MLKGCAVILTFFVLLPLTAGCAGKQKPQAVLAPIDQAADEAKAASPGAAQQPEPQAPTGVDVPPSQARRCSRPSGRGGRDASQVIASAIWHLDASIRRTVKLGQGTEVLAWYDVSGNGVHATAAVPAPDEKNLRPLTGLAPARATLPTLVPGGLGGTDAVHFAGGAALQIPARNWGLSFTAVLVVQARALHAERFARILDIATNALLAGPTAQGGAFAISVNPFPRAVTYHPFGGPGSSVIAWSYDAGCELVLLNGAVALDLRDDAAHRLEGPIGIGNLLVNPHPSYWFNGDIGEVIFFGSALPRDELAAVSDALRAKWRL